MAPKPTLTQRVAAALYPPKAPALTERELARDTYLKGFGFQRKPPAPISPYERGSVSPLGGRAVVGHERKS